MHGGEPVLRPDVALVSVPMVGVHPDGNLLRLAGGGEERTLVVGAEHLEPGGDVTGAAPRAWRHLRHNCRDGTPPIQFLSRWGRRRPRGDRRR